MYDFRQYIGMVGLTEEEEKFIALNYDHKVNDSFFNKYEVDNLYQELNNHETLFKNCIIVRISGNSICISRMILKQ